MESANFQLARLLRNAPHRFSMKKILGFSIWMESGIFSHSTPWTRHGMSPREENQSLNGSELRCQAIPNSKASDRHTIQTFKCRSPASLQGCPNAIRQDCIADPLRFPQNGRDCELVFISEARSHFSRFGSMGILSASARDQELQRNSTQARLHKPGKPWR